MERVKEGNPNDKNKITQNTSKLNQQPPKQTLAAASSAAAADP